MRGTSMIIAGDAAYTEANLEDDLINGVAEANPTRRGR
jgi:hypothetical protein